MEENHFKIVRSERLYRLWRTIRLFGKVSLFMTVVAGCATGPRGTEIQVDNPYREHQTIYAASSLTQNLVSLPAGAIALPPGWLAARSSNAEKTSVVVELRNDERTASGRYEIVDLDVAGVSRQQARLVYERTFGDEWAVDGRYSVGTESGPIFMIHGTDEPQTRVGFFRSTADHAYVADFIVDTGDIESNEAVVQELYDYVVAGDVVDRYGGTARLRDSGVSFFAVHSGFRWIADTPHGVVLAGTAGERQVLFEIDRFDPTRSGTERAPLAEPVVRHRLIGNQAALLTFTELVREEDAHRFFGIVEVAPAGSGQRYDVAVAIATSTDSTAPRIDAIIDSDAIVALVRDELILSRR